MRQIHNSFSTENCRITSSTLTSQPLKNQRKKTKSETLRCSLSTWRSTSRYPSKHRLHWESFNLLLQLRLLRFQRFDVLLKRIHCILVLSGIIHILLSVLSQITIKHHQSCLLQVMKSLWNLYNSTQDKYVSVVYWQWCVVNTMRT